MMRHKIISCFLLLLPVVLAAQQPAKGIRIADTLTTQEKLNRDPVILKTELDSLIRKYAPVQQLQPQDQQLVKKNEVLASPYLVAGVAGIVLLLFLILWLLYRHQQKVNRVISGALQASKKEQPPAAIAAEPAKRNGKLRMTPQALEARITELNAELHKLEKENEGLNRVIKEYNGIQHEYDSIRHGMAKVYKIRNYPGYDKAKDDAVAMQRVLETENSVALYAYEKFLKPVLLITDTNKNNPAKISDADSAKLLELLVSLSLLYIEYLYLRVQDLSIGGKMVERIKDVANGKEPDISLLKKLNTEFGSRALVIRMALNKAELSRLSYPVFDETNLNNP